MGPPRSRERASGFAWLRGLVVSLALAVVASLVLILSMRGGGGPMLDLTVGQSNLCAVHKTSMKGTLVPILYGLYAPRPGSVPSHELERAQFPNAERRHLGGCCVSDDSPRQAFIFVCPACDQARRDWHP